MKTGLCCLLLSICCFFACSSDDEVDASSFFIEFELDGAPYSIQGPLLPSLLRNDTLRMEYTFDSIELNLVFADFSGEGSYLGLAFLGTVVSGSPVLADPYGGTASMAIDTYTANEQISGTFSGTLAQVNTPNPSTRVLREGRFRVEVRE